MTHHKHFGFDILDQEINKGSQMLTKDRNFSLSLRCLASHQVD